jgi:hypothetical protein
VILKIFLPLILELSHLLHLLIRQNNLLLKIINNLKKRERRLKESFLGRGIVNPFLFRHMIILNPSIII